MKRLFVMMAFVLAFLFPNSAFAGRKVALVIGVADYAYGGSLTNTLNDANLIERHLKDANFEVLKVTNSSQKQFKEALRTFHNMAYGADVAVFYFSGHGIGANGENWFVPSDAQLESEYDLADQTISLNRILEAASPARVRVVALDACRNNPFEARWKRDEKSPFFGDGLGAVSAPIGTMIIYATAPGKTASDGKGRNNSPFAEAFAIAISQPGIAITDIGNVVVANVAKATANAANGRQEPWVSSSIIEDAAAQPAPAVAIKPAAAVAPSAPPPSLAMDFPMVKVYLKKLDGSANKNYENCLQLNFDMCNIFGQDLITYGLKNEDPYTQDVAAPFFLNACHHGIGWACANIALMFKQGTMAIKSDRALARAYYDKACTGQGDASKAIPSGCKWRDQLN